MELENVLHRGTFCLAYLPYDQGVQALIVAQEAVCCLMLSMSS